MSVGGGGYCARSDDGLSWETCTGATDDGGFEHVRSTVFLDGLFYTADADGDARTSADGDVWTFDSNVETAWIAVDAGQIVTRDQSAPAEFADLRLRGSIERAEAGSDIFALGRGDRIDDPVTDDLHDGLSPRGPGPRSSAGHSSPPSRTFTVAYTSSSAHRTRDAGRTYLTRFSRWW